MARYKNADPMEYGLLKAYARENRKNQTEAESILWSLIKRKSLGVTFLRQYIIGDYITDFACLEPKLVIEVDGGYHSEPRQAEDDAIRQEWLEKQGFKVIRFTNAEVECDIENTINKISIIKYRTYCIIRIIYTISSKLSRRFSYKQHYR